MSLTLTLTGTNSVLATSYFPALNLSDGEYELGLTNFETYNTIPNITSANNKFYFDTDKTISIPEGSYELSAIANEIECAYQVDFTKPNNIGSILGYSSSRVIQPNKWYSSDKPVNIMNVSVIRVECNITSGAYNNDKSTHTIHEFATNIPPGYKLSDTPINVIYLPVIVRNVTDITIRIVAQNGQLINFRGEEISVRLHVRRRR
ncbi:hypothetical protein ALC60_04650 [Trachymyrmex zeteki]|uniref:Uncharacterized protein n=1 Tax=Mycetomoellerius zeteki TaxID=64791 RepID=A0A151X7Y2_9HYME|nr:hypothetical protein ALC60_04650 [Trachymyrmex zeteki]